VGASSSEIALDVLYEDEQLIFVNKPPRLVVQRGYDPDEPILLDLVAVYAQQPVHLLQRLDRGTSGVIFFSKSSAMNVRITRQFEKKRVRKRYLALCEGELAEAQTIDAPIARVGAIKFAVRDDGKRCVTHVAPIVAAPAGSLVDVRLETGRTHQIRVHLSAIGHALAGDWLYGLRNAVRPMLHAAELEMTHPMTNKPLRVAAPVPADFLEEMERRGIVLPEGHNVLAMTHVTH
jgi:23S rRNA pseudouridine1911/1915/1917 synthase